jgi:hypothetical protein
MSATSSQYYRSADTHSHYPNFSANNNEHLYALAASWHQDPNHASYAGPPSAPYLHYSHGGADPGVHPASNPQTWPVGYGREDVQGWNHAVGDHAYTSRPALPYDAVVPRPISEASQHYQHPQNVNIDPELPLSPRSDAYRSSDRFHSLRITSVGVEKVLCLALKRLLMVSRNPPQMRPAHLSRIMLRGLTHFHDLQSHVRAPLLCT